MTPSPNRSAPTPASFQSSRVLQYIIAGVILLGVSARLYLIFSTRATEEDFYITLRYAENLARGAGLVYNPGEHVLGTTTPLYTLLLALFIRLHLDPVLAGKLLAVGADALSCGFVWRLGCILERPMAGLCAALCLAIAPLNLIESVKGMEVSLVACASIGAWMFWSDGKNRHAWLCAGLVTLLRIDGVALAAILLLACLWRDRKMPWTGLFVFASLTLPWIAYSTSVFGSPIPASLRAKLVVYGWHNSELFPNAAPFFRIMTHNPLNALLFAGAILMAMMVGLASLRSVLTNSAVQPSQRENSIMPVAPMLAWLILYYGGMALSKVFLFGWYFLPPTPAYYLAACMGWGLAANLAGWRFTWEKDRVLLGRIAVGFATLAAVLFAVSIGPVTRVLRDSQRAEDELRIPIGLWLKEHGAPHETVMLEPIGYIGYYSGLRVLDTVGLVSPEVLPLYRKQETSPYHALWYRFQPTWVLLRTGEWQELQRFEQTLPPDNRLSAHYRLIQTWQSPGTRPDSAPAFYLFQRIEE